MSKTMKPQYMRLALALLLCLALLLTGLSLPVYASAEDTEATRSAFHYQHDPRLNPSAMADIQVDPTAIYGFSPREDGSLKQYATYDWSDPAVVLGENGRPARIAYHESIAAMYTMLDEMTAEGKSVEEIARAVSTKRNEIRLAAYANDPEGLANAKARNLERYGHEEGPLPDELYEQYGSWEMVIEKAFSVNSGMDACLGLYDDYYSLYVASGQIEPESVAAASREYTVAAFLWAAGYSDATTPDILTKFADADAVSPYYASEMAAAVENGLIKGYENNTLRPQSAISRIEAFVLLSRCLPELEAVKSAVTFDDVPAWAEADIARLSAAGLIEGYGDGSLGSRDTLTVAQVSLLLDRLSANGASEITDADRALFDELVAANSFTELMKRHSSSQEEIAYYDQNEEEYRSFTFYADADQFVNERSDGIGDLITGLYCLSAGIDDEGAWLAEYLYDQESAHEAELASAQEYTSLSVEPEETLTEAKELNGCWYMTTEISDADWISVRLESDAALAGLDPIYTYAPGMTYVTCYIFDQETQDLLEIWTYLRYADGTEYTYGLAKSTYDQEYDFTNSLFAPYLEATEFRMIHLVFAPGTPEESEMTYAVPKDVLAFIIYQGEVYRGTVYTDAACTQVYDSSTKPDEVTLYIPASKITDDDKAMVEELVAANSFTEVMKRHSSKQVHCTFYDKTDEEYRNFTEYVNEAQFVHEDSEGGGDLITGLYCLSAGIDDEGAWLAEFMYDQESTHQEELAGAQEYTALSIEPEETLTEVTVLNGCWYVTTEMYDVDWISARLEREAERGGVHTYEDGMTMSWCYIFDMETQDILEIWTYLRYADGTEYTYGLNVFTYDQEYDFTDSLFAPYFEATEYSMIHLVFAPGTPEESEMTYAVPKDIPAILIYQGERYRGDFYTDAACTQVYTQVYVEGERPDELTLYIPAPEITDADRALLDELITANSFTEVMKRHSSKQLEHTTFDQNEEAYSSFTFYADADQFVYESSDGSGELITGLYYVRAGIDEIGAWLSEYLYDQESAYQEELADAQEYTALSVEPEETLTDVTELNGCWYLTTELSDADWISERLASDAELEGVDPIYTYAPGMTYVTCYIFDQETQDLLELWTYLRYADGTEYTYNLSQYTYDQKYDFTDSLFTPYLEATEYCMVYLVYAPGTPEESTMTYAVPKNIYMTVFYQGEVYEGTVYTDAACTQEYTGGERPDELTLYIPVQS